MNVISDNWEIQKQFFLKYLSSFPSNDTNANNWEYFFKSCYDKSSAIKLFHEITNV